MGNVVSKGCTDSCFGVGGGGEVECGGEIGHAGVGHGGEVGHGEDVGSLLCGTLEDA